MAGIDHEIPQLRLNLAALEHNIALMSRWCLTQGWLLCPHIKTTMTRPIVERQIAAGAWGVTVATVTQAAVALRWGLRRILIANEVVTEHDLARLRGWLDTVPDLELYVFVDSGAGVDRARRAMSGTGNRLGVIVDVGTGGARTGVRDIRTAREVAAGCRHADGLRLAGVGGYEGVQRNERDEVTLGAVDAHIDRAVAVLDELVGEIELPLFTMGGSAFPDRVVAVLGRLAPHVRPVLRSGCYVTHDHGTYARVSPIAGLRAALTVRAAVLSTPEPGLAVLGAGKRELAYDAGLPVVLGARARAATIFDHHLVLTGADGIQVGDLVDLGISHPCSVFDRWRQIAVTDRDRIIDVWRPEFD
ncbi:alanine racemase [Mycobacterium adipatum]|uniref:alanine racemase n=1 Tax=Mycobacterium adipatum TaxID=1682113 RepID=UPI0034E07047